ncbi:MAG TPA: hypothetical protein VII45_02460, partial [Solirubrobacterales bacterium]
ASFGSGKVSKFSSTGKFLYTVTSNEFISAITVDPSDDDVFIAENGVGVSQYNSQGLKLNTFGPTGTESVAIDPVTHDVWLADTHEFSGGARHIEKFVRTPATITVPTTTTEAPDLEPTSAVLHGTINADGVATTSCRFEWGSTLALEHSVPCLQGNVFDGSEDHAVTAAISGLTKGGTYYFRLTAKNGNGRPSPGLNRQFIAEGKPIVFTFANQVNTDGVQLNAEADPNGGPTTYRFEWGLTESYGSSSPQARMVEFIKAEEFFNAEEVDDLLHPQTLSYVVTGLAPGTSYHYRIVIENEAGTVVGEDHQIKTYVVDPGVDPCPNSQVRKQTESGLLLNCRAYELVSAANAGGYDVESDLIPGQSPFDAHPMADGAVLYGLSFGSVPGIAGSPTNFGLDPYVATRGSSGWTTRYVGLPADGMADHGAFGSPLLEADSGLGEFAFGGPNICEPCFEDGSTNVPLRLADGSLVKGMAGSRAPAGNPAGYVGRRFSKDGKHFVFSSKERFENVAKNGELTIYDRDLSAGATQVVSTLPNGSTMSTAEAPGELDVSADGSRILIGKALSTDEDGNTYWHPYMHLGTATASVDLAPTTTTGVLYAGMSSDGSKVFFTTPDKLLGSDEDESADLYEAEVSPAGSLSLKLLSGGSTPPVGNTDACDPAPNANGNNWNAVGASSVNSCGVLAIGGGGGIASAEGSAYFLSPEALDGSGVANQPNLFVSRPGQPPHFIATLETSNPVVLDALKDSAVHHYGDFQVTPDGQFAAYNSKVAPPGVTSFGHTMIYRYDALSQNLLCASCTPTGAALTSDASLAPYGLSLADDGRLFFASGQPYVLRDTNGKKDAYEWENGTIQLISTGASPDDSTLLSVSSDGKDAYFFTRQTLVHGDENGSAVKVYDAREGGGFLYDPPPFPCAASDECHGPGTQAPPAPNISTVLGSGRPSEVTQTTKHKHKKHGRKHHHKKQARGRHGR